MKQELQPPPDIRTVESPTPRPERVDDHKTLEMFERSFGIDTNDERWKADQERIETTEQAVSIGDFQHRVIADGRLVLSPAEQTALNAHTQNFSAEVKDSPVAITKGYKVAGVYDTQVQGWTTRSKIVQLPDGERVFVLCSYPASWKRRTSDRLMEFLSGDPMRKPKPETWKSTVESRSNVPIVTTNSKDVVAMPFIESFNAYDLFAHQKDIKDFGPFSWAESMSVDERLNLLPPMVDALRRMHDQEKTWGEAILQNVILTRDQKPTFIDPETTYENIPLAEQKATDVRNLILSICGALARSEGFTDVQNVVETILDQYADPTLEVELAKICTSPITLRQRLLFNAFTRFRIGATDLNEFRNNRTVIAETIARRAQGTTKTTAEK